MERVTFIILVNREVDPDRAFADHTYTGCVFEDFTTDVVLMHTTKPHLKSALSRLDADPSVRLAKSLTVGSELAHAALSLAQKVASSTKVVVEGDGEVSLRTQHKVLGRDIRLAKLSDRDVELIERLDGGRRVRMS